MRHATADRWEDFRETARELLADGVAPETVHWRDAGDARGDGLFGEEPSSHGKGSSRAPFKLPPAFLKLARSVACHRDPARWETLYRTAWRLMQGERRLMSDAADPDVVRLDRWSKAVRRDVHKMKAFVRFRQVDDDGMPDGERFVAWHRPDHRIVRAAAPFFVRRFAPMHWSILTPDESAHWDTRELSFGPGVPRSRSAEFGPDDDPAEELWDTYYRHIFNPARVKIRAMKAELPVRHWATLPEAAAIPELIRDAGRRERQMIATTEGSAMSAADYLPDNRDDLSLLNDAAAACRGCGLHEHATQTVFGKGPADAELVFVGEQPGDNEDKQGEPFVGPAGQVLNDALEDAGIDRSKVYITNAVKHFKYTMRGSRRLHAKPT
ncbi:MAG: TIGR03915 family putative DNA repair protein, partial [Planctomycetota bacterium]